MSRPVATLLPCGKRLHLQHGPIDLIIGADEPFRRGAFAAAIRRFETVLEELIAELPALRTADSQNFQGDIARRMSASIRPHASHCFVTPMAAVAGSVADIVLHSMVKAGPLKRAYVNNGGDIALHLEKDARFDIGLASSGNLRLGQFRITSADPFRGIATSGQGGRSLSLGIAESVTVLARSAAQADVAATLIANAVDLPDHPAIERMEAWRIDPDSDLGARNVVTNIGVLSPDECVNALDRGVRTAEDMLRRGLICGAALFLRDHFRTVGLSARHLSSQQRTLEHA